MKNKIWTWDDYLKHFIKDGTISLENMKISLGNLNDIVSQRNKCDDFERYFTIYTVTDPDTKEKRVVCPPSLKRVAGYYCGDLKKPSKKIVQDNILNIYRNYICDDLTPQIEVLESLRRHPLILSSERAAKTLERLIASSHAINKQKRIDSIRGLVKKTVNCLIRPVLIVECLDLKEDNFLNYRKDKDFILLTIQEIVEDNQINDMVAADLRDENGLLDTQKYYKVFL